MSRREKKRRENTIVGLPRERPGGKSLTIRKVNSNPIGSNSKKSWKEWLADLWEILRRTFGDDVLKICRSGIKKVVGMGDQSIAEANRMDSEASRNHAEAEKAYAEASKIRAEARVMEKAEERKGMMARVEAMERLTRLKADDGGMLLTPTQLKDLMSEEPPRGPGN